MNVFVSYLPLVILILNPAVYSQTMIPEDIDKHEEEYITISGEVKSPGRYVIKKGARLSSVLKQAGGYTDNAYLRAAVLTREKIRGLRQRIPVRLTHPRLLKGSQFDIELEGGDSLHIPPESKAVNVEGAVMSHGSYMYSAKLDYEDYIKMAGGYSEYADNDSVYVLKVDGAVMRPSQGFIKWNDSKSRWELTAFSEDKDDIEPGDTIVVLSQTLY